MKDKNTKQRRKYLKQQQGLNFIEAFLLVAILLLGIVVAGIAALHITDVWGAYTCEYYNDCQVVWNHIK